MVLADPDRVHAELVGEERFFADVQDEALGTARIVGIMIVTQGEIAEFHAAILPLGPVGERVCAISCICNDRGTRPPFGRRRLALPRVGTRTWLPW